MGSIIAVIIIVVLHAIGLGIYAAKNGERSTTTYSFGFRLFQVAITMLLYWWAGLFEVFG